MLYKQILLVSLTGSGLFTTHTFAGNYYFYADSGDTSCANATANDICNFDCNVWEWKQNFNCGQAGQCNIYCSQQKCLETATISASNVTNHLNVYASGEQKECYKSAHFNLPNYGNATFSITGSGNNPFKQITINSGTNTNRIIIDCDGDDNTDDCKQITVNAQNAQYLEINIADAMLNGDKKTDDPVTINCPQNSNYNGPHVAPCYITAVDGGSINYVVINTLYGIPMDVWIDGDNILYESVTITGANIGCVDQISSSVGFTPLSSCWYTNPQTTSSHTTISPSTTSTSSTTTTSPTSSTSTSLATTTNVLTYTTLSTQSTAASTTYNTYSSTFDATDRHITTVSTMMSVATTVLADYFEMQSESDIFNANITTIILIVIFGCIGCIVFIMFGRFTRRSKHNKEAQNNAGAVVDHINDKNEIVENKYRHGKAGGGAELEINHVPSLCMVATQSTSLDMMNVMEVNTAGRYGENESAVTPIEIEIEGNILNNNKLNLRMQSNDDIEIIFEDDEVIGEDEEDMDIIETVHPQQNNDGWNNAAIEIALQNFTTKK